MKKSIIVLAIAALTVGGCGGRTAKKQTETTNSVTIVDEQEENGNIIETETVLDSDEESPEEECFFFLLSETYYLSEEPSDSAFFITESVWKGLKCKVYRDTDSYSVVFDYTFPNANLQQVYDIVQKKETDMESELPVNNLEFSIEDKDAIATYTYIEPKHLYVELSYAGGVTTVEILEKKNETLCRMIYSPD